MCKGGGKVKRGSFYSRAFHQLLARVSTVWLRPALLSMLRISRMKGEFVYGRDLVYLEFFELTR